MARVFVKASEKRSRTNSNIVGGMAGQGTVEEARNLLLQPLPLSLARFRLLSLFLPSALHRRFHLGYLLLVPEGAMRQKATVQDTESLASSYPSADGYKQSLDDHACTYKEVFCRVSIQRYRTAQQALQYPRDNAPKATSSITELCPREQHGSW